MKKSLLFFIIVFVMLLTNQIIIYDTDFSSTGFSFAYENQIVYAKASSECMLYKTDSMDSNLSSQLFYIPETYFVSILSKVNDDILKVQYSTFTGYCYANKLSIVRFQPTTPTLLGISFDISPTVGTQIWSEPSDTNGKKLVTISANTKIIEYVAATTGTIPIGATNNIWYYARYTPSSNTTAVYEGYIHSESTTNLTNIPNNLEVENIIDKPNLNNSIQLNDAIKVALIILIILPFLILFVISVSKAIKHHRQLKHNKETETQNSNPQPTNHLSYSRKINKQNTPKQVIPDFQIDFPEYEYIDDDDLLWFCFCKLRIKPIVMIKNPRFSCNLWFKKTNWPVIYQTIII